MDLRPLTVRTRGLVGLKAPTGIDDQACWDNSAKLKHQSVETKTGAFQGFSPGGQVQGVWVQYGQPWAYRRAASFSLTPEMEAKVDSQARTWPNSSWRLSVSPARRA